MRNSPRSLYLFASTVWAQSAQRDERSPLYESAEERLTRESGAHLPARQKRWITQLHEYEAFWGSFERSPRENTRDRTSLPAVERRLGEWGRYQRRFKSDLSTYQRIRLDVSPAFDWDPQEAGWWRQQNACVAHVKRTGLLPTLDPTDLEQFALARWLSRQLRLIQSGTIAPKRGAAIRRLLAAANCSR
jgi:hypothetical protein